MVFIAKFTLHYCDEEKIQSREQSMDRWKDSANNPGGGGLFGWKCFPLFI